MDGGESPEQLLAQQKASCVFCKIISGEIPSKKVFEDDSFLAILDIRPATPGHVLLLPKEHVPILPLLPAPQQQKLFETAVWLSKYIREALISQSVTVYVANGFAAGQQAPHLLVHLIPREQGDKLGVLDLQNASVQQPTAVALTSVFAQASAQTLVHLGRADALPDVPAKPVVSAPSSPSSSSLSSSPSSSGVTPNETLSQEFSSPREALEAVLASNPDLRKLIIAQPDVVMEYVAKSPKLAKLFEGVNIPALSHALRQHEGVTSSPSASAMPRASELAPEALFQFIANNNGLRTWLLEDPKGLEKGLAENPRLAQFLEGIDIVDLADRFRDWQDQDLGDGR